VDAAGVDPFAGLVALDRFAIGSFATTLSLSLIASFDREPIEFHRV
jgi:hypothetical protein